MSDSVTFVDGPQSVYFKPRAAKPDGDKTSRDGDGGGRRVAAGQRLLNNRFRYGDITHVEDEPLYNQIIRKDVSGTAAIAIRTNKLSRLIDTK